MFSIMFLILATKGFGMLKVSARLYWACYISALNSTPQFLMTTCSLNCTCDRDGQSAFFLAQAGGIRSEGICSMHPGLFDTFATIYYTYLSLFTLGVLLC